MKYLTDRTEIGKAINFGKYPVLFINRENRPYPDVGSDYSIGCKVRVAYDNGMEGMTTRAQSQLWQKRCSGYGRMGAGPGCSQGSDRGGGRGLAFRR